MFFQENGQYRCAVYLRLSRSDGDQQESNSIKNQRALLNDYLGKHPELHKVDEYVDDGYSGTNFERPDFKRMMQDIENRKINCIVVKDLSRFGRNYIETGRYVVYVHVMFNNDLKACLPTNMTHHFSCGVEAAKCYFGQKVVDENDYVLIPNAIDVERFIYNPEIRNKIRKENDLENKHVVGHVGRFMAQKNHTFLMDVFAEVLKIDSQAHLVLLGDGELMDEIKRKTTDLGISEHVTFVGNVGNANEWYQAFDCFVLPSIWEGLPVVGVEAQAADLPCVFSSAITREIGLSQHAKFVPLTESVSVWAKTLCDGLSMDGRRGKMKFQNLSVKRLFGRVAMGLVLSMSGITIALFLVTKQIAVLLTGGALLLCALVGIFVLTQTFGKRLSQFTADLCQTLDHMIAGNEAPQRPEDSETQLARIGHRLARLYQIMQENRRRVDEERQELQTLVSDISHQVKTPVSN